MFVLYLTLLAVATPWGQPTTPTVTVTVTAPASTATEPASNCSTGPIQCCDSVETASDPAVATLLELLGIVVEGLDVLLGLNCSPVSVIGVGGGSCSAEAVCCEDNSLGSLISIGCVPVTL
ncbi:hydrophobin [Gelatoporia subvermispora B]|uniref:Hydrophobin n=1 Tax=Ceriporiopsis subvermispora (strain B) TaxID=914234 RepID=M2R0X3_CERS8|nr:hydrophobin [Gelatoporia subvermispora B]